MSKPIFEHIANVTYKKIDADSYTESDWKSYSPYMMNKWLSMNRNYIDIIDLIQPYYGLDKKIHYKMLSSILPKRKAFTKYIKGKKDSKYNPELINILCKYYEVSKDEIKTYLQLFYRDKVRILSLISILEKYGYDKKQIKKLTKV
tara:strand:+ start:1643 stop:2080 length:438 start_codon:yes stop_codon:yes gene_type:complete